MDPLALPMLARIVVLAVAAIWWHTSRSSGLLQDWARENGFEIVASERRWLRRGPFFWTTSKGQEVFHVTARDDQGRTRHAFVRVGGYWMGLLSSAVDWRRDE